MGKKNILVTGGMGGIGDAICMTFGAHNDYRVITTYSRNEQKAQLWQERYKYLGYDAHAFHCDVTDFAACAQLVAQVKEQFGVIDILVNNAGITRDATFRKMSKDMWDAVINTNLTGMFNITKHVVEDMVEQAWGRIINISSINGQKGQYGQANYSAAKAGVHGFTMALAQEVVKRGVTVNTIAPGYIATDMVMAISEEVRNKIIAGIPMGRLGEPREIADLVMYLASDSAAFMTGAELAINGGQHMM
jgi:acetoacetyl-CoA reductase